LSSIRSIPVEVVELTLAKSFASWPVELIVAVASDTRRYILADVVEQRIGD
jgi:hypothetical protein